jgi:hypothetical protein
MTEFGFGAKWGGRAGKGLSGSISTFGAMEARRSCFKRAARASAPKPGRLFGYFAILPRADDYSSLSLTIRLNIYTPTTLLPAFEQLFRRLTKELPPEIVENLVPRRVVKRHGSCNSVLMWKFWDRRQTSATLPIDYNGYGINYDPNHFETTNTDWILKLKFNTVRVYATVLDVRRFLINRLPKVCPGGFIWTEHPRELRMEWPFSFFGAPEELPDILLPKLLSLVKATYPVVDSLLEAIQSGERLSSREQLIDSREPSRARAANGARVANRGALSHSISFKVRQEVLRTHGYFCSICGNAFLETDEIHIDHVVPFSRGGLTIPENLKPAHARCNLMKGSGNKSRRN